MRQTPALSPGTTSIFLKLSYRVYGNFQSYSLNTECMHTDKQSYSRYTP